MILMGLTVCSLGASPLQLQISFVLCAEYRQHFNYFMIYGSVLFLKLGILNFWPLLLDLGNGLSHFTECIFYAFRLYLFSLSYAHNL